MCEGINEWQIWIKLRFYLPTNFSIAIVLWYPAPRRSYLSRSRMVLQFEWIRVATIPRPRHALLDSWPDTCKHQCFVLYKNISNKPQCFTNKVKLELKTSSKEQITCLKQTLFLSSIFNDFNMIIPLYNDHLSTKSTILKSLLTELTVSCSPVVNVKFQIKSL